MPTPGPLELVIILVIALLILGPGKLPDVGSALGKSIKEFRKASSDVQEAVTVNVDTSPLPAAAPVATAPAAAPVVAAVTGPVVAAPYVNPYSEQTAQTAPAAPTDTAEATPAAAAPASADSSTVTS